MAEVMNMSINVSYSNFNGCALDLRKRGRESPEGLACPKRFKFYAEDDSPSRNNLVSPVTSPGSLTPSPTSSLDYSMNGLNSPPTPTLAQRPSHGYKVHAPVQWPSNGYSISSLVGEVKPAPFSPADLHARYSDFFDYAKNKFSLNRDAEESRRTVSRSPPAMPTPIRRSPPALTPINRTSSPAPTFGLVNPQFGRSTSLSPVVMQPGSPVDQRLVSTRPRSTENLAHSPFAYSMEPRPMKLNAPAAETYSRTRGPHSHERMSPVSLPRADSSLSGKASPLSQPSSLDVSESSEGLTKAPLSAGTSTADDASNLAGLYLDHIHPVISLTDKIISAGVSGKPTRPFKAYPKDPLFLATSLAAIDPEEFRYSQQEYYEFREKMLALSKHNSGQAYPKMKRCGSPAEDAEGTRDALYWERRRKNNEAAKRSRDARKAKEDEIAIRAAFLENQNRLLTAEIKHLRFVTGQLKSLAQERGTYPR